ncbi:hypothetical protein PW52_16830, partial [Tamlana sedimentorum]
MKNKLPASSKLFIVLFCLTVCINKAFSQVEIAKQRFHNGDPSYQKAIADKDGTWAPPSQTITAHSGTDNWDYTATTVNGFIRVVNSDITTPASDLYCLEIKNYWDDTPSIVFAEKDLTNYTDVTFSIAYQSLGEPDNNEHLILDYSYYDGSVWVDNSVNLIDGVDSATTDIIYFNASGPNTNPFEISIPNSATAFRATVRSNFIDGSNGNDNYYIDDVILSGQAVTTPPVASCVGDFSITLDAFGSASITASDIDNGSSVSSGTMSLSIDKSEFNCDDLGENVITLTVDDGTQTSICTTTVTVNQYSGPLVAPTLNNVSVYCYFEAETPEDIHYQCNTVTPTTSDATTFNTPGTHTITWTYFDAATGNSDTATQTITLNNQAPPAGVVINNITANSATVTWNEQVGIDSYEIQYKKDNLVNWDVVTSTSNSVDLELLDQKTLYNVRVSALCNGSTNFSSIENFTTASHDYCEPDVSNDSALRHISNIFVASPKPSGNTINNNSAYDNSGYTDYTDSVLAAELYKGQQCQVTIKVVGESWAEYGYRIWVDFNGDGNFDDDNELAWTYLDAGGGDPRTSDTTINANFDIPSYAVSGVTAMRIACRAWWHPSNDACDGSFDGNAGEVEDYPLSLEIKPDAPQEIDVTGNGNMINDGAGPGDTLEENNTDFGNHDIFESPLIKTFRITNNGADPLTLTGNPIVQFVSTSGDFTIAQPSISVLAIGESTTFTVAFDPNTVGTKSAVLRILNDDVDLGDTEDDYTFNIVAKAVQDFPDTDGDGVPDNVDGDDDNDGILDTTEDNSCKTYPYATTVEMVFLNETFGSGYNRVEIDEYNDRATTTYCYEDGSGTCSGNNNLGDGSYTIYYRAGNGDGTNQTPNGEVASWADQVWYTGLDHTPDSEDGAEPGRMLLINASHDPGVFYSANITGVTPGVEVTYGFSVINLDRSDAPCLDGCPGGATWDDNPRNRPEVLIAVYDANGNSLIPASTSGLIEPTDASNPNGDWVTVETTFTTNSSQFTIQLINSQDGGQGNDLAIDDIYVKQILCDLDGDGVADSIDLDNDDDGIPNVVELGLADTDKDATLFGDGWVDTNQNGVHDSYESGATLIDTDGDGVPDYIDADSDNDGIFDNVEYDGKGDIDVDGDGSGDGSDANSLLANDDADGDGILAVMDGNDNDTDDEDHGSASYPDPLDSDNDGIPDYLEVDSNNDGVFDIKETIYLDFDADNDGIIDGTIDVDNDGILDTFDTDSTVFGSPRDLNEEYTLYFDGRNDYISENVPVINAWGSATLMAWIKIPVGASGQRRIAGQDNFYITVNSDGTASAVAGGNTLTSMTVLPNNIWVHIAASFNNPDNNFVLYVNGEAEETITASAIASGVTDFTIGRRPGVSGEENVLTSEYFKGEIDEVRLFNFGLSEDEIQKMIYQELDDASAFVSGNVIPSEISATVGSSLQRYYKMNEFLADITSDEKAIATGAKLYNIKNIYFQTAPLPYET